MASIKRNKSGYNGSSMAASRGRFAGRFRSRGPLRNMARPRPRPRPRPDRPTDLFGPLMDRFRRRQGRR